MKVPFVQRMHATPFYVLLAAQLQTRANNASIGCTYVGMLCIFHTSKHAVVPAFCRIRGQINIDFALSEIRF